MELILHTMYVIAIKDRKAWAGDTPAQISMIGFWNLITVWLKVSTYFVCVYLSALQHD
jgi:D-alanyl-lipoteichoic acid acyltransferase DltB (MBOAT superfamily)